MSSALALPSHPAVLSGKYALSRALGAGSAGTVYEAENLLIGRRVALKRLRPSLARNPAAVVAFLSEARAAARISHPNVVDILDTGVDQLGIPYIVMELLEGETLEQILDRRGPVPVRYACELMLQVLSVMDAAHRAGIVHRDLKPANVIVTHPRPDQALVKVLDFGIASGLMDVDAPELEPLKRAGTPLYMAPEQALGAVSDGRVDVFSVGVMLYELLSGKNPFEAATTQAVLARSLRGDYRPLDQIAPHLPDALVRAVHAAMSADVGRRISSAAELAAELAPYVDAELVPRLASSGLCSLEPIPLLPRFEPFRNVPESGSCRVIGLQTVGAPAWLAPRIPRPAPLPTGLGWTETEHVALSPRVLRRQWLPTAFAVCGGFALGTALAWASGLF